jgi:NADH dehydrogenase
MILLVGATGNLGGRIARRLVDHGLPFRALVRPATDPGAVGALASEVIRGDLRDPEALARAVEGIETVISSAHSLDRIMAGRGDDVSIESVDRRGNANLVAAAAAAAVTRFVFVSFPGPVLASHTPFAEAKVATEALLRASPMHEVIVRPDAYQESWLSAERRFDWRSGTVTIFGSGEGRAAYIAMDDVAEAIVRLATLEDAPRLLDLGGPETMSANELVDAFERATGSRIKRQRVPRLALRLGSVALRRAKPGLASVLGMVLLADERRDAPDDRALRALGITGKPVSAYIREVVLASEAGSAGGPRPAYSLDAPH